MLVLVNPMKAGSRSSLSSGVDSQVEEKLSPALRARTCEPKEETRERHPSRGILCVEPRAHLHHCQGTAYRSAWLEHGVQEGEKCALGSAGSEFTRGLDAMVKG